jgi:ABC-type glycerol-3-phosphate transport system substrate-binding protein
MFFLAGCSSGVNKTEQKKEVKIISNHQPTEELNIIGHWLYQGKRENLVREMTNEFEFRNQNCKVNLKFPEEVYYSRDKVNSEEDFVKSQLLSEHPTFDILRINDAVVKIGIVMHDPDWAKKYLVDFSQFPEFINNTIPELVNDSAKVKWGGIIPGPYLEGYNYAIWYNKNLAQKIGINIKQFGMTFDDLVGYIKALNNYNKSQNTIIVPIHDNGDWSTINVLALRLFISELDDLKDFLKDSYDNKKLNAYYKTLKALEVLAQNNTYSKTRKQNVFEKTVDFPLNEKCLFYVNASWMYNYWEKVDKVKVNDMVPAELPVFKPNDTYFGGYSIMWAVPKNAPHKDEAIKFMLYMNTPDVAEKWTRYTKCPTGIKGNITSVTFGQDQFEDFTYTINKKYGAHKLSFNYLDYDNIVVGISKKNVNVHINDVATGVMTADEAMADIRKQLRNYRQ